MRYLVILLGLSACAGANTPPDAWVFRPPAGQPSLIEAVKAEQDWGRALGQFVGGLAP
jgi:hypothetical protein